MRYEKGHKATTRERITSTAAKRFREDGLSAVGLTGIMAEAGLTNGAFYAHFKSRDELVAQSLDVVLREWQDEFERGMQSTSLEAMLRLYLSAQHRDQPGDGCATASLLPEIGRQSGGVRSVYTERLKEFVPIIASRLPLSDPGTAERTAMSIFGLVVGALQLSRTVDDPVLSEEILEGAIASALRLASPQPGANQ